MCVNFSPTIRRLGWTGDVRLPAIRQRPPRIRAVRVRAARRLASPVQLPWHLSSDGVDPSPTII